MINSPRPRITSMGFWLPCSESVFFHHDEDSDILDTKVLADHRLKQLGEEHNNLQASVFHRLMAVLYHKHYTHVYPLPDPVGVVAKKDKADPKAIIFAAAPEGNGPLNAGQTPLHWRDKDGAPATLTVRGVALLVNDSGYYLWMVVYESAYGDGSPDEAINDEARTARNHLQEHIFDCIGGEYFSHYSGSAEDLPKVTSEAERTQTLKSYQNDLRGMLTFYQINLILEGLYNSTLDPRIFFASESEEQIEAIKKEYSLAQFINLIASPLKTEHFLKPEAASAAWPSAAPPLAGPTTVIRGTPSGVALLPSSAISQAEKLPSYGEMELINDVIALHTPDPANIEQSRALAMRFMDDLLVNAVRRPIIQRFLSATSDKSLQTTKRRVERCRRALLSEMLEVTHRRQPLLQIEPPDDNQGERIEGVDEDQLRGYVMLLAAKLPLITTVELHLKGIIEQYALWKKHSGSPWDSWRTVMRSISHDISRLETALEQANMDRQLEEEEQIRAEQETLAELERLRSRTEETISPTFSLSINYFANIAALIAVALGVVATFKNFPFVAPWKAVSNFMFWVNFSYLIIYAIMLGLLYFSIQGIITWFLRLRHRNRKHAARSEERFYYEFDLRLQAPITGEKAQALFNEEFGKGGRRSGLPYDGGDGKPTRNTYRVQRTAKDAALHKVYIEADLFLREHPRRFRAARDKAHAILVYEIRFHSPTKGHEYILQDVRVVINHRQILTMEQIDYIKQVIATHFVNCWITDTSWQLKTKPIDALFTLNHGNAS
ncbi:MAG: hypothetical protein H0X24_11555 [Ktedonobacterales bacterium]|nr:hypothetical protein [Ktedonobacterales bacterium]